MTVVVNFVPGSDFLEALLRNLLGHIPIRKRFVELRSAQWCTRVPFCVDFPVGMSHE